MRSYRLGVKTIAKLPLLQYLHLQEAPDPELNLEPLRRAPHLISAPTN
ncbi:MAG: hypothetical protein H6716_19920 [Polyangiaceae bacterium]|nr:hypothetical protein [Polyangiaceae bacterium]